jgi:hypothetical protein
MYNKELRKDFIEGFGDRFVLFENGDCYDTEKEKWLNKSVNTNGYCKYYFTVNGKKYQKYVHRLVGLTFLENPNNYDEINHKDCDKLNNNLSNLEWCSRRYNLKNRRKYNKQNGTGCRYIYKEGNKYLLRLLDYKYYKFSNDLEELVNLRDSLLVIFNMFN